MTPDQKNMLIANLYKPMFDYIEALTEHDKKEKEDLQKQIKKQKLFGFLPWVGRRRYLQGAVVSADKLRSAYHYAYEARAKFEARVDAILNAYLNGKVQPSVLPESVAVVDATQSK